MTSRRLVMAAAGALLAGSVAGGSALEPGGAAVAAAARPDLVPVSITGVRASVQQGAGFGVTVKVRNAGSRSAAPTTVRFYLSADGRKDGFDLAVTGGRSVPALAPARTFTGSSTLTVPVSVPTGT